MSPPNLDPRTSIDSVHVTITSLDRSIRFYRERIGLAVHARNEQTASLGADGGRTILVLHESPRAEGVPGTTGLYHFAILVPSRADLSQALRRLVSTRTVMQGFSDHGVSESLYLADPDGNGIEIYRDRARADWPTLNGKLAMRLDPLDVEQLLAESRDLEPAARMPSDTVMGHIHLRVGDLDAADRFYREAAGFDLIARIGGSAAFLSAGGYHHHIAVNTWAGVGAPAPPPGAVGLREFVIRMADRAALEGVADSLARAGVTHIAKDDQSIRVSDPSGNVAVFRIA